MIYNTMSNLLVKLDHRALGMQQAVLEHHGRARVPSAVEREARGADIEALRRKRKRKSQEGDKE
jgi:hypothetical protein